jgi:hypothetical protein
MAELITDFHDKGSDLRTMMQNAVTVARQHSLGISSADRQLVLASGGVPNGDDR